MISGMLPEGKERTIMAHDVKKMSDEEIVARIVQLGFGGDERKFERFKRYLREVLPAGTEVALRGSVVTNEKWENGQPFDADGPGTSDLDVTLIGAKVLECWEEDAFYLPAFHTKPLDDKNPEIARAYLNNLRLTLQEMVGRPVCFQATSNIVMFARDVLFGQPYFKIIEAEKEEAKEGAEEARA
jgi:hypothetical protein